MPHTQPTLSDVPDLPLFFVFISDLIQLYAPSDTPSVLTLVSSRGEYGKIALASGRVVHAELSDLSGACALHRIMSWDKGELHSRRLERSSEMSILSDLSTTLLDAYDHIVVRGACPSDPMTLEESTSDFADGSVSRPVERGHYSQLVWKENVCNLLKEIDGFVSFQLIDIDGHKHSPAAPASLSAAPLSESIFKALCESDVIDKPLELYLSLASTYHAFIRVPVSNYLLYVACDTEETTQAMVQFKLNQIIEDLPYPQQVVEIVQERV